MNKIIQLMKLTIVYLRPFSFRNIIVSFEFLLCILAFSLSVGTIQYGSIGQKQLENYLEEPYYLFNTFDEEANQFCAENGRILESYSDVPIQSESNMQYLRILSEEFANVFILPLQEGNWFSLSMQEEEFDLFGIVPANMKNEYLVGNTYDISTFSVGIKDELFPEKENLKLHIIGVLAGNVIPGAGFFDYSGEKILCMDNHGIFSELPKIDNWGIAVIENKEIQEDGILSFQSFYDTQQISMFRSLQTPFLMAFFLMLIFVVGFLSNYYMYIKRQEKSKAILYMLGCTNRDIVYTQFLYSILLFIPPALISMVLVACFGNVLSVCNLFFSSLCCLFAGIFGLLLAGGLTIISTYSFKHKNIASLMKGNR